MERSRRCAAWHRRKILASYILELDSLVGGYVLQINTKRKCWPEQTITKPTNCYMLQLSPINHFCLKGYVLRDWSNKINIGKNTYHRMDGWIKGSGFLCRSADDKYIIINSITRNTLKTKNCELIQFPIPDPWW